jgi:hypothetical protein
LRNFLKKDSCPEIPVELKVTSRGSQDITVSVDINFYSPSGDLVETLDFKPISMISGQESFFRKFLNTSGFRPGDYEAEALVDYGSVSRTNKTVRIGSLFVNVTNVTGSLEKKEGIQKFHVNVESFWNDYVKEVYADVNISNSSFNTGFRTPSKDLEAWKEAQLVGFLDTSTLTGEYESKIMLHYEGSATEYKGRLEITEKSYTLYIAVGVVIAIALIGVIVFAIFKLRKKKK